MFSVPGCVTNEPTIAVADAHRQIQTQLKHILGSSGLQGFLPSACIRDTQRET